MKKSIHAILPIALAASLLPATTNAQLQITEVESSENAGNKADWWELTNFGSSAVDITGYTMDDNSASYALSVALSGITTIGPGESVAFFEVAGSTPLTIQGFRDWWGLGSSVQVGTYTGSGVGLSSTADAVNLYNSSGTPVNGVSFGTATKGVTFGWNPNTGSFGGLSQAGINGAYVAPQDSDIGSPGVVPEPSTAVLTGLGAAVVLIWRRRK
jgi:hypothetical protein